MSRVPVTRVEGSEALRRSEVEGILIESWTSPVRIRAESEPEGLRTRREKGADLPPTGDVQGDLAISRGTHGQICKGSTSGFLLTRVKRVLTSTFNVRGKLVNRGVVPLIVRETNDCLKERRW